MPIPASNLLTRLEAAEYLGLKPSTLAVWQSCRRYGLPVIRVGRLIRYSRADLDEWLCSRRVAGDHVIKKAGALHER